MRARNADPCRPRTAYVKSGLARTPRPAFTLFELMLVLAVVVLLSAIAYPSIEGMYGGYRLRAAVDMVRAAWADAESHAVNEGRAYRFAVQLDQGMFRLAPDSSEFWGDESTPANLEEETEPPLIVQDTLPKGVRFTTNDLPVPTGPDQAEEMLQASQGRGQGAWVPLVTFLPDGTARENVEVTFQGQGVRPVMLCLRGLTGVVSVKFAPREGGKP